jgi:hypothetical protein
MIHSRTGVDWLVPLPTTHSLLCIAFPLQHRAVAMENTGLPTIGCYATNIYATVLNWWAYPCKCLTFGCLATTGVPNFRLPNNDGIRPNTSHYSYLHKYIRTYIHVCIHTHMHACMPTCIHTHIYTYTHALMHAYTHTYMHTHIHTYPRSSIPNVMNGITFARCILYVNRGI